MEIVIKVTQFLLSLSILVVLHELGHFSFAKLFGARVEKFYMFFNPWFSLFKFKKGDTEYGIGWLPLGGYVKISGMIDESMDKEQLAQEPKSYEFRSKPAWQRLLIMIGGVLVNFVLAFVIYAAVLYTWGEQYLPAQNVKYGVVCDSLSQSAGFQNGDKIVSLDDIKVERFSDIVPNMLFDDVKTVQVIRHNKNVNINIPGDFVANLLANSSKSFSHSPMFTPRIPMSAISINGFAENSSAKDAGVLNKDRIQTVNGDSILFFDQFQAKLRENKGKTVSLNIKRDDNIIALDVRISDAGLMGVGLNFDSVFETNTRSYTILESIPAGVNKGFGKISSYIKQFKLIFSPETKGYKSLGGFITIGSIFPSVWDWYTFWNLTAFLSIVLAIMNILPIPALDGGHVLFLLYEIITGRKPGDKFMEYAQITGMVLLFGLLIFANANDVIKLFSN